MKQAQVMEPATQFCVAMHLGKPCQGWVRFDSTNSNQWVCSHCGSRWDRNGKQAR